MVHTAILFIQWNPLEAFALLVAPLALAALLYRAPTTILLIYGLVSIYAGYALWLMSSSKTDVLGVRAIYIAIGAIISGIAALAFGGCLTAILRALKRR